MPNRVEDLEPVLLFVELEPLEQEAVAWQHVVEEVGTLLPYEEAAAQVLAHVGLQEEVVDTRNSDSTNPSRPVVADLDVAVAPVEGKMNAKLVDMVALEASPVLLHPCASSPLVVG